MDCGRQFQTLGLTTEKAQLPNFMLESGTVKLDMVAYRRYIVPVISLTTIVQQH